MKKTKERRRKLREVPQPVLRFSGESENDDESQKPEQVEPDTPEPIKPKTPEPVYPPTKWERIRKYLRKLWELLKKKIKDIVNRIPRRPKGEKPIASSKG